MGYSVLLIAIEGKSPEAIHKEYDVDPTEEYEEIAESPVTGLTLQNGHYLIYDNAGIIPEVGLLARLSKNASLTLCQVNETVMYSTVHAWRNGVEVWSVCHDANQGSDHLETTGNLPDSLDRIREKQMALQDECEDVCVDFIFDIPVELFVACGGIRYDEDPENAGPEPWQVLNRVAKTTKKKKWWWPFS